MRQWAPKVTVHRETVWGRGKNRRLKSRLCCFPALPQYRHATVFILPGPQLQNHAPCPVLVSWLLQGSSEIMRESACMWKSCGHIVGLLQVIILCKPSQNHSSCAAVVHSEERVYSYNQTHEVNPATGQAWLHPFGCIFPPSPVFLTGLMGLQRKDLVLLQSNCQLGHLIREGLGQELHLFKAYFWIYKMMMNRIAISQNSGTTRRDSNVMSSPWLR